MKHEMFVEFKFATYPNTAATVALAMAMSQGVATPEFDFQIIVDNRPIKLLELPP